MFNLRRKINSQPTIMLYDATCRFCDASSRAALRIVPQGAVVRQDINDPKIQQRYNISTEAAQREMHVVDQAGTVTHGAAAVRELILLSSWLWPLAFLWRIPGFGWLAQKIYLWVADHRYLFMGRVAKQEPECENGACAVHLGLKKTNS